MTLSTHFADSPLGLVPSVADVEQLQSVSFGDAVCWKTGGSRASLGTMGLEEN